MSVENLKTTIHPTKSLLAFYYHCATFALHGIQMSWGNCLTSLSLRFFICKMELYLLHSMCGLHVKMFGVYAVWSLVRLLSSISFPPSVPLFFSLPPSPLFCTILLSLVSHHFCSRPAPHLLPTPVAVASLPHQPFPGLSCGSASFNLNSPGGVAVIETSHA